MALAKWQRNMLERLLELVELKNADFWVHAPVTLKPVEVTEFIKERTRLYRESWVIPLIKALLENDRHAALRLGLD